MLDGKEIPGVSHHNVKLSLGYNPTHQTTLVLVQNFKSKAYAMSDFLDLYGKMEIIIRLIYLQLILTKIMSFLQRSVISLIRKTLFLLMVGQGLVFILPTMNESLCSV